MLLGFTDESGDLAMSKWNAILSSLGLMQRTKCGDVDVNAAIKEFNEVRNLPPTWDKCYEFETWRLGIVVIASAYGTEDPGFESRQGVRFLGIYSRSAVVITIVIKNTATFGEKNITTFKKMEKKYCNISRNLVKIGKKDIISNIDPRSRNTQDFRVSCQLGCSNPSRTSD
jgi:hypothetical protein